MRLFVAIELDERVRSRLEKVQAKLRPECDGVRWVRPELIHLTLKFLGEVPDSKVAAVTQSIARAVANGEPLAMTLTGTGCFPPRGPVRIVWVGAEEPSGKLVHFAESVDAELARIGFPREQRPFSPHLTIGRVQDDRSGGKLRSAVTAVAIDRIEQAVESVTLMSSVLSPKGPTYHAVSRAKLGERPDGSHCGEVLQ